MSAFNFDNYQEFGLFFKINSQNMLNLSPDLQFHEKIGEYILVFDHSKGGCGCNINKRRKVAGEKYETFVPELFSGLGDAVLGEKMKVMIKETLNNPSKINFKKDSSDEEPFFSI
tara:strand:+ start:182 stop:526 length:345 start_codon:yes stop_codon:yes gene_type:complete